jgi:hypothetical protein
MSQFVHGEMLTSNRLLSTLPFFNRILPFCYSRRYLDFQHMFSWATILLFTPSSIASGVLSLSSIGSIKRQILQSDGESEVFPRFR